MGKIVGVINQKGGVGKTTTTIELAAALTSLKKKIMVIDLDQQGNLTDYMGGDNLTKKTIFEVLQGEVSVDDAIQKNGGIDLMASSPELSRADKVFGDTEDIFLLGDVVKIFRDKYDYILIDNGPSRSSLLTMTYAASDGLVIPTEADSGSINGIKEIYNDLEKYRKGRLKITDAKILMMILNKYENTIVHSEIKEELKDMADNYEDHPIIATVRKSIVATESKAFRQSMQEYSPKSTTADDYKLIAKKLITVTKGI